MHRYGNKEQIAFTLCNIQYIKKELSEKLGQVWYVTKPIKQSLLKLFSLFLLNLPACYNKAQHRKYICEENAEMIISNENCLSVMSTMTVSLSSLDMEIVDTWKK